MLELHETPPLYRIFAMLNSKSENFVGSFCRKFYKPPTTINKSSQKHCWFQHFRYFISVCFKLYVLNESKSKLKHIGRWTSTKLKNTSYRLIHPRGTNCPTSFLFPFCRLSPTWNRAFHVPLHRQYTDTSDQFRTHACEDYEPSYPHHRLHPDKSEVCR